MLLTTQTDTEVRRDSPVEEGRQVVEDVSVQTEARLLTEGYISIGSEVELRVEDLHVAASAYVDTGLITEVRTYEEGSTVELQRFLSRLYLDFLSVDFILLVLTSDDDAVTTVLLILQILLDEADVIAGLTRLLSTSDLLSLRRVDSVEAGRMTWSRRLTRADVGVLP